MAWWRCCRIWAVAFTVTPLPLVLRVLVALLVLLLWRCCGSMTAVAVVCGRLLPWWTLLMFERQLWGCRGRALLLLTAIAACCCRCCRGWAVAFAVSKLPLWFDAAGRLVTVAMGDR
jgi:hypothetical protein